MVKEAVKIGNAIREGYDMVKVICSEIPDDGTSNLDSCIIRIDNDKKLSLEIIEEVSGIKLHKVGKNHFELLLMYGCQGYRRTKITECLSALMNDAGFDSYVSYQID